MKILILEMIIDNNEMIEGFKIHDYIKLNLPIHCLERIIRCGARLDHINDKGRTPLHEAAEYSILPFCQMELLIAHGAPVDAIDKEGSTVLHAAIMNPNVRVPDIVKLLRTGINPDIRNKKHYPPLANVPISSLPDEEKSAIEKVLIKYTVVWKLSKSYYIGLKDHEVLKKKNQILSLSFYRKHKKGYELSLYRDACIVEIVKMKTDFVYSECVVFDLVTKYCNGDAGLYLEYFDIKNLLGKLSEYVCYRDILQSIIAITHPNFYLDTR